MREYSTQEPRRAHIEPIEAAWPSGKAGDCKSLIPGSNPGAASILILVVLALGVTLAAADSSVDQQQRDVWSEGWVSDIPVVELTGTWLFDPKSSDPMVEAWREREVRYQISQQPDHIDFEFVVEGGYSILRSYRWDGTVTRFNRSGSEVEEIARWTDAGRVFEVRGRRWLEETPDDVTNYELRYEMRIFKITFTQTNHSGSTVWTFTRERR